MSDEPLIAVFIDFENLAIGVRHMNNAGSFQISLVLKRLLEKGRIAAQGSHQELLAHSEIYAQIYHQQLKPEVSSS